MENTLILLYFYSVRINLKKEKTQQDKLNELKEKSTLDFRVQHVVLVSNANESTKKRKYHPTPLKKKVMQHFK